MSFWRHFLWHPAVYCSVASSDGAEPTGRPARVVHGWAVPHLPVCGGASQDPTPGGWDQHDWWPDGATHGARWTGDHVHHVEGMADCSFALTQFGLFVCLRLVLVPSCFWRGAGDVGEGGSWGEGVSMWLNVLCSHQNDSAVSQAGAQNTQSCVAIKHSCQLFVHLSGLGLFLFFLHETCFGTVLSCPLSFSLCLNGWLGIKHQFYYSQSHVTHTPDEDAHSHIQTCMQTHTLLCFFTYFFLTGCILCCLYGGLPFVIHMCTPVDGVIMICVSFQASFFQIQNEKMPHHWAAALFFDVAALGSKTHIQLNHYYTCWSIKPPFAQCARMNEPLIFCVRSVKGTSVDIVLSFFVGTTSVKLA